MFRAFGASLDPARHPRDHIQILRHPRDVPGGPGGNPRDQDAMLRTLIDRKRLSPPKFDLWVLTLRKFLWGRAMISRTVVGLIVQQYR